MDSVTYQYDDGGRSAAGFSGTTRDCVVRAVAIATGAPYVDVYRDLKKAMGKGATPRDGVPRAVYEKYLKANGWHFVPCMGIGTGCRVHLIREELPQQGAIICRLSRHLVAVVNGTIRDIYDCSRNGTRCVYGYYRKG